MRPMKCKTAKRGIVRNAWKIAADNIESKSMSPSLRRYIGRCASVLNVCKKNELWGIDGVTRNMKPFIRFKE